MNIFLKFCELHLTINRRAYCLQILVQKIYLLLIRCVSGQPGAVEKYLGFLHAGGSDYSLNILKNAGVDLNTPQPVTVTLQRFAEKLQELKALLGR